MCLKAFFLLSSVSVSLVPSSISRKALPFLSRVGMEKSVSYKHFSLISCIIICIMQVHSGQKCLVWVILAGNQGNHHNFDPTFLPKNLWLIFMGMKQNGQLKKTEFFKITNSQYFLRKFQRLVLGLVGLIDAKGIDLAQPIWSWGSAA